MSTVVEEILIPFQPIPAREILPQPPQPWRAELISAHSLSSEDTELPSTFFKTAEALKHTNLMCDQSQFSVNEKKSVGLPCAWLSLIKAQLPIICTIWDNDCLLCFPNPLCSLSMCRSVPAALAGWPQKGVWLYICVIMEMFFLVMGYGNSILKGCTGSSCKYGEGSADTSWAAFSFTSKSSS